MNTRSSSPAADRPGVQLFFKIIAVCIVMPLGCTAFFGFGWMCYRIILKNQTFMQWIYGTALIVFCLFFLYWLMVICFYVFPKVAFQKRVRSFDVLEDALAVQSQDGSVLTLPFHTIEYIDLDKREIEAGPSNLLYEFWQYYGSPASDPFRQGFYKIGYSAKEGIVRIKRSTSASFRTHFFFPWRTMSPETNAFIILTPESPKEFFAAANEAFFQWRSKEYEGLRKRRAEKNKNLSFILHPERGLLSLFVAALPNLLGSLILAAAGGAIMYMSSELQTSQNPFKWIILIYFIPIVLIWLHTCIGFWLYKGIAGKISFDFLEDRLRYNLPFKHIGSGEIMYNDISTVRLREGIPAKWFGLSVIEIITARPFLFYKQTRSTHVLHLIHIPNGKEQIKKIREIIFSDPEFGIAEKTK